MYDFGDEMRASKDPETCKKLFSDLYDGSYLEVIGKVLAKVVSCDFADTIGFNTGLTSESRRRDDAILAKSFWKLAVNGCGSLLITNATFMFALPDTW